MYSRGEVELTTRTPNLKKADDDELIRKKEIEEKARKRTRGPYRKSSHVPVSRKLEQN